MSAFEELGVSPELIRACDELGWALPTPVQAEAVPLILGGGDVMVGACSSSHGNTTLRCVCAVCTPTVWRSAGAAGSQLRQGAHTLCSSAKEH
jgi:hypothetical protein